MGTISLHDHVMRDEWRLPRVAAASYFGEATAADPSLLVCLPAAAHLSISQRSLLAEVETQAFCHGRPMLISSLYSAGHRVGTAYSYERWALGLPTGVRDGVVLLDRVPDGFSCTELADEIAAGAPADVATFRVAGPTPIADRGNNGLLRGRHTSTVTTAREVQEVIALGSSYAQFLQSLGRSTRRNVRDCGRLAAGSRIAFDWSTDGATADPQELQALGRCNMPAPVSAKRIASVHRLIGGQARQFHGSLRTDGGELVSAAGGILADDVALMLYQYNHGSYRSLNLSLMLRAAIIERLCGLKIRHLAFVGRCSGLLRHACDRVPAAQMLIYRNSPSAHLKMLACRIAEPRSRIGRLLASSASRSTQATRGSDHAAPLPDRMEDVRQETALLEA